MSVLPRGGDLSIVQGTGPFYLGVLFNVFLAGVNWMQLLEYFSRPAQDRALVRAAVIAVFVIGGIHTALSIHPVWFYAIDGYGDLERTEQCPWSVAVYPVFTALVATIVQSHYAWRIFLVGKRSPWVPSFVVFLTLAQLVLGTYVTAIELELGYWDEIHAALDPFVATWLFTMAISDVVITAALSFLLSRVKSEFGSTKTLLNRIVRNIVANNGLTAAAAVTSGVLFVALVEACWHMTPGLALARFYTLSLMSSLNSRQTVRDSLLPRPRATPEPAGGGPKAFWLGARSPRTPPGGGGGGGGSPAATTSPTQLFVRPVLSKVGSSLSGASSLSEKEKGRPPPGPHERGLRVPDSLPITIQLESIADDLRANVPSLIPGDTWDPQRFYTNPLPSPSASLHDESDRTALDMAFLHAIEVSTDDKTSS
ncbi:uncharacterized protein RHOBADRAFT_53241 [Rhodotorula graminis WP1]|uniref:DUF6534 domain-containing protein n=1 Tax=Rhodotorula graminis (strain WP1) TaxID=578459 RepID=A0A194S3C5_RHOGW|nr:uncharacterized protein RHOBADRAFT_53241 [Rhodotorula graminis WP1]KPV75238.1 hypothetical protein RHOBADRAFT_53241 [Rhodotorula graminis WP1]